MFPSTPSRKTVPSDVGFSTPDRRPEPSTTSIKVTHARAVFQATIEHLEDILKATRAGGPFAGRLEVITALNSEIAKKKVSLALFEEAHGLYPRSR